MRMTGNSAAADAAATLRRILAGIDDGTLDAEGRAGGRLRHRMEGAVAAFESMDANRPDNRSGTSNSRVGGSPEDRDDAP